MGRKDTRAFGAQIYMYAFIDWLRTAIHVPDDAVLRGYSYDRAEITSGLMGRDDFAGYIPAAAAAAEQILSCESGMDVSRIAFMADIDAVKSKHDMRDVVITNAGGTDIGVSFRPGMHAIRRPNLFGPGWAPESILDWLDIGGSAGYRDLLQPVANFVSANEGKNWSDVLPDAADREGMIFAPVLAAFMDEIQSACRMHPSFPSDLIRYLFGADDYYQVTILDRKRLVKVMGYNINSTLSVAPLELPTRLIEVRNKEKSTGEISPSTMTLVFDNGWTVDIRIYMSTKTISQVSLKFTVDLVGKPYGVFQAQRPFAENI